MAGEDEELVSATIFDVMNAEFPNQTQLKKIKALLVYNITKDAKLAATFSKFETFYRLEIDIQIITYV